MQRCKSLSALAGVTLLAVLGAFSPSIATAQVIDVSVISAPVNTLSVSDVDFLNTTTPKWLFTVNISTQETRPITASMEITLRVRLSTGEELNGGNPIITITTKPPHFEIHHTRTITNLDLNRSIPVNKAVVDAAARRRLEETALPSGVVPAGSYQFHVVVTPEPNGPPKTSEFTIALSNPSPPVLIAPADRDQNVSEFPFFQWQYDGPRAQISIYEMLPGQSSPEETASGIATLTQTVTGTAFQYPPGGGTRALKPGKTYVWSVTGLAGGAGGTESQLRSTIRSFSVSAGGTRSAVNGSILDEVERALPQKYAPLFQHIRAEGLSPTSVIRLNGNPISTVELLKILGQLRANPDGIGFVGLE